MPKFSGEKKISRKKQVKEKEHDSGSDCDPAAADGGGDDCAGDCGVRPRGSLALEIAQPEPLSTTTAPATVECLPRGRLALVHGVANPERKLLE